MTTLVTGGAGFIGSHMVLAMVEAGEQVVVVDNLSTGVATSLPAFIPLIVGDCGDQSLMARVLQQHRVDAILHFAASIVVPDSIRDPLSFYKNNTVNSRALLSAAVKVGVPHFIFSSTAAVYGEPTQIPIDETAATTPISPYGRSKLMAEIMLRDAGVAHGLKYAILRYFNVAGADPFGRAGQSTPDATHLIKLAVRAAIGTDPVLKVYGTDYPTSDGTCIRDYIHVCDLVRAHTEALSYLRAGGESVVLNCGYGHGYSVLEVVQAVVRVSGRQVPIEYSGRRAGDPAVIVADSSKLAHVLNWAAQFDELDTIVMHALAWERSLAGEAA